MTLRFAFAVLLLIIFPKTVQAQTLPQFGMPVDCTLGKDCWVVNYVDVDPAPDSAKDFKCGTKTYEGHKGTDFALRSRIEMAHGVNVLAAKDGKVLRLRDGEDDLPKTEAQYQTIRDNNRDCGNGVILDHGNGLVTYYCHLKQGSILVKPGDPIKEGQPIAQIGQSGFSEFPHLHFTVIWEGGHIDPFTGMLKDEGCDKFKDNIWKDDLSYTATAAFDGGFDHRIPDWEAIKIGQAPLKKLNADTSDALVYWAGFYHARQGDDITLTIRDPEGNIFAKRAATLKENRKRPSFYYTGRKLNGETLKPGTYTGEITYTKPGFTSETATHQIEIE